MASSLSAERSLNDSVVKQESERLEALARLASEEAILFNQSLGLRFEEME